MSALFFLILLIGFYATYHWYYSPKMIGKRGERTVHNILEKLPEEYTTIEDVVLKTSRGTTQIDHIVISKYGIFEIETKNYRGEIYGDDYKERWTQIIVTNVTYRKKWYKTYTYVTKNKLYSPVKQSLMHMYEIKKNLKEWPHLKVIPIVVFTGDANLENVRTKSIVIHENRLIETILSYKTIYLTDAEVENVVERIRQRNVRELVDDDSHVNNIRANMYERDKKIQEGICPKCGGNLVLRTGPYGRFYGCSNYPKCKFKT